MADTSVNKINAHATGQDNEIRMILLGRTGTGKSSAGNTILGQKIFDFRRTPNGVTKQCSSGSRDFQDKRLFIVDTPGFLDPSIHENAIQEEVAKSYQLTAFPGPHAFLLVFDLGRMTPQEYEAPQYLTKIFGDKAFNYTIIIFTHGDELKEESQTLDAYRSQLDEKQSSILRQCGDRCLLFDNKGTKDEKDEAVQMLLESISNMTSNYAEKVYISDVFTELAKEIEREKAKGTFEPFKPDGSYTLMPQTKAIVIDGYLRRTIGRRAN